jgi:hypothetical protein
MTPLLAACGGFLIAVLWMDLMFDVQVLRHRRAGPELPERVLASIAGYYRRVTTDAWPMNYLIAAVMVGGIAALIAEIATAPWWRGVTSLLLLGGPVALAAARVVPNAVRLGTRADSAAVQSALARAICREHLLCLAAVVAFFVVHVVSA